MIRGYITGTWLAIVDREEFETSPLGGESLLVGPESNAG
jgi:hypothetical protein